MTTTASLVSLTLELSVDVGDADTAVDYLADLDTGGLADGYPNEDPIDDPAAPDALYLRSDAATAADAGADIDAYEANTLLVYADDGTLRFDFVADEQAVADFTEAIETVREPTGAGAVLGRSQFTFELADALDLGPQEVIGATDLPEDADVEVQVDEAAGTTRITFEITQDTPPKQLVDTIVPGLVSKYADVFAGLADA